MTTDDTERIEDLLAWVRGVAGPGAAAIVAERIRQREVEGWTDAHDDAHDDGSLAQAAACYALHGSEIVAVPRELLHSVARTLSKAGEADGIGGTIVAQRRIGWHLALAGWPWDLAWDKRAKHPPERRVAIAGALLAAEWDRLARARAEGESDHDSE